MRPIENLPSTYSEAVKQLGDERHRKIANNTALMRHEDDSIALYLHFTPIAIFRPDGRIALTSGGYHTAVTKRRLNVVLKPHGLTLTQRNFDWLLVDRRRDGAMFHWFDGLTIRTAG